MNISHLSTSYGYWAVFLLVGAERLGIPLPGETALIIAGTYAGTTHRLSPWLIFAVAAAGAIIGDNIGYWIGDKGGYALARRYGHKVRLDERKLKIARYLFDRHGAKVVFFGRFVSILRTYAAFLAGTSKMRWRRFLAANAAGGILWAGVYTLGAHLAGNALQRASGTITWALAGTAVVAIAAGIVLVRRQAGRLAVRAEAAYPDPLASSRRAAASSARMTKRDQLEMPGRVGKAWRRVRAIPAREIVRAARQAMHFMVTCVHAAKYLPTVRRALPWYVWLLLAVASAVKAVPVDFGADEVLFALAFVLIAWRRPGLLRALYREAQAGKPAPCRCPRHA